MLSSAQPKIALTSLPSGLRIIQPFSFYELHRTPSPLLPSGVTSIGICFQRLHQLTTITFSGTPATIDSTAFSETTNLTTINVPMDLRRRCKLAMGAQPTPTSTIITCRKEESSMRIKTLYQYTRPDGGMTIATAPPEGEYLNLYRLIADEEWCFKKMAGSFILSLTWEGRDGWVEGFPSNRKNQKPGRRPKGTGIFHPPVDPQSLDGQ